MVSGEEPCEAAFGVGDVPVASGLAAEGEVLERGAARKELDARQGWRRNGAVAAQQPCEEARSEIAIEPREVKRGVGDGGVGPIDHPGQRPVELQDVLGAQVSVGDDSPTGWTGAAGVHKPDEVAGPVELLEPGAGVGVFGGDEVLHSLYVDGVKLAQKPTQPGRRVAGSAPPEQRTAGDPSVTHHAGVLVSEPGCRDRDR